MAYGIFFNDKEISFPSFASEQEVEPQPVTLEYPYLTFIRLTGTNYVYYGCSYAGRIVPNWEKRTYNANTNSWSAWSDWGAGSSNRVAMANVTTKLQVRRKSGYDNSSLSLASDTYLYFNTISSSTGTLKIAGNIESLRYNNPDVNAPSNTSNYCYCRLFYGANSTTQYSPTCSNIVDASELYLPSQLIATRAYQEMFKYCTGLVKGPVIGIPKLGNGNIGDVLFNANSCVEMFYGDTLLDEITLYRVNQFINSNYCPDWATNVSRGGTFITTTSAYTFGTSNVPYDDNNRWIVKKPGGGVIIVGRVMYYGAATRNGVTQIVEEQVWPPLREVDITLSRFAVNWADETGGSDWKPINETTTVIVTSESPTSRWTLSTDSNWIHFDSVSGTGSENVLCTVDEYHEGYYRTGTITLTYGNTTKSVTLKQNGCPYLCIEPATVGSSCSVQVARIGSPTGTWVCMSKDSGEWYSRTTSMSTATTYNVRELLMIKSSNVASLTRGSSYYKIQCPSASGNIHVFGQLKGAGAFGKTFVIANQFQYMFNGNTKLASAQGLVLPPYNLVDGEYYNTFNGCTNLEYGPIFMNTGFTSQNYTLTNCFYNSTRLKTIYLLWKSAPTSGWSQWMSNVASSGTLYHDTSYTPPNGTGTSSFPSSSWTRTTNWGDIPKDE